MVLDFHRHVSRSLFMPSTRLTVTPIQWFSHRAAIARQTNRHRNGYPWYYQYRSCFRYASLSAFVTSTMHLYHQPCVHHSIPNCCSSASRSANVQSFIAQLLIETKPVQRKRPQYYHPLRPSFVPPQFQAGRTVHYCDARNRESSFCRRPSSPTVSGVHRYDCLGGCDPSTITHGPAQRFDENESSVLSLLPSLCKYPLCLFHFWFIPSDTGDMHSFSHTSSS